MKSPNLLPLFASLTLLGPASLSLALPFPGSDPWNKLTAPSPANGEKFGRSVAADGNLLLVGADGNNADQGIVHLFDFITGEEIGTLVAPDGEGSDEFGFAVALSETRILAGAPGVAGLGAAYLFDRETGELVRRLTAPDANEGIEERFGSAVALSGNLVVIGAFGHGGRGNLRSGRGSVYVFDAITGNFLRKLEPSDAEDEDAFGFSVAIADNLAVVGAPGRDDRGFPPAGKGGKAYLFDATDGTEIHRLDDPNPDSRIGFGTSVAIRGDRVFAGFGTLPSISYTSRAGVLFDTDSGNVIHELSTGSGRDDSGILTSAAIGDDFVIVGGPFASRESLSSGVVLIFDLATGSPRGELLSADREFIDRFGWCVALNGNRLAAGAPFEDGGGTDQGAVYVFEVPSFRPDNLIGPAPFSGVGDNLYNPSGNGQEHREVSRKLRRVKGWVTVTNDGTVADDYTLVGSRGNRTFGVGFFRQVANRRSNVTAAMIAGTHGETSVAPGNRGRLICAEVKPSGRLKRKSRTKRGRRVRILRRNFVVRISTSSDTFDFRRDTVRFRVRTR